MGRLVSKKANSETKQWLKQILRVGNWAKENVIEMGEAKREANGWHYRRFLEHTYSVSRLIYQPALNAIRHCSFDRTALNFQVDIDNGNSSFLCSVDNGLYFIFKYKDRNSDAQVARGTCFVHELSNDFFMTLLISRPLNIIMEEDELSSRSPSPSGIKARRRHARITRGDFTDFNTALPSPGPPTCSPASSPDSLKLAFPDLLKFPFPPASELSSSPGAHSSGMPLTPDSDYEFTLPSPRFNPRRAAIQPLVLNFNRERVDSDEESDSEWYHKEFSKLIESPHSPQLPPSRPDSVFLPSDTASPTTKRRSMTTDTVYPRRKNSKSKSIIPNYPPPVPPIPLHLRRAPSSPPQGLVNFSRPPPRSSLPADCVVDFYMDGCDEGDAESDSSSAFSFTMYEIDFGERQHAIYTPTSNMLAHPDPQSPHSTATRLSLDSECGQEIEVDPRFELDYQITLPFSTPLDLETDISRSFEKLRAQDEPELGSTPGEETPASARITTPSASSESVYSQDPLYTPTVSPFSFPPSPSVSSFDNSPCLNRNERTLKSKWSSSTLGSVQEEARSKNREMGRGPSAKWKLFGGGGSTPSKRSSKASKHPSSPAKSATPPTPTSPLNFKSPSSPSSRRKSKTYSPPLSPSSLRWPPSRTYKSKRTSSQTQHTTPAHQPTNSSDVIIIGYGQAGLKRRGSNATVSSQGGMSEVSSSSSSSSGLRRKPIPIEMFLRNAA